MTLHSKDSNITPGSAWPFHFIFSFCCLRDFRWISMERMVPTGDIHKVSLTAWQLSPAAVDCPSASSMFLAPQPAWITDIWCKGQPVLTEFSWHWQQALHTAGETPHDWKWWFRFLWMQWILQAVRSPPASGYVLSSHFGCLEHTFVQCKHFKIATDNCSVVYVW